MLLYWVRMHGDEMIGKEVVDEENEEQAQETGGQGKYGGLMPKKKMVLATQQKDGGQYFDSADWQMNVAKLNRVGKESQDGKDAGRLKPVYMMERPPGMPSPQKKGLPVKQKSNLGGSR